MIRTRPAPYRNAAFAMSTPIGPAPITKTRSPLSTDRDATCTAFASGSVSVATSSERSASSRTAAAAGTANRSAKPPVMSRPTSRPSGQWFDRSSRHQRQAPHGHDRLEHHALAEPRGGNPCADLGDLAHRLVAHDERRDAPRARLAEPVQVRPADRRCARRDHHLARVPVSGPGPPAAPSGRAPGTRAPSRAPPLRRADERPVARGHQYGNVGELAADRLDERTGEPEVARE